MARRKMSRWHASGLHLAISAAIAACAVALMLLVWYPPPLFEAEGGARLLFILTGVDVVLGPLITLVIFRQGKRGLKLDLAVIGVVQLCALVYGVHIVFIARPAYIVFNQDHYEIAHAIDLAPEELARAKLPQYRGIPVTGPVWVAAVMPSDPAERNELVTQAFAGRDLQEFPLTWVPYESRRADVLAKAMTLERLGAAEPTYLRAVEEELARSGTPADSVRFLLLRARRAWLVVIIDAASAAPRRMVIAEQF
jgi:hypothetical protein